jgi:hypothetical protein
MKQFYYIFSGTQWKWVETDEDWVKDDIEKIEFELVNNIMSEEVRNNVAVNNSGKKKLLCYIDTNYSGMIKDEYWYPSNHVRGVARWRLQLDKSRKTAIIYADVYEVKVYTVRQKNKPIVYNFNIASKNSLQHSLRLDYGNGRYIVLPAKSERVSDWTYKYDWTERGFHFSTEIPQIIVDHAMTFLKELAIEEFGFSPTVSANIPGYMMLKYFTQFPLDTNVGWYADRFGYDFSCKVNRKNDSNFALICDYLKLPKTKGLRKAYHENYASLIICFLLKEIGVEDINIWQYFYGGTKLMGVDIGAIGIDRNYNLCVKKGIPTRYWWDHAGRSEVSRLKDFTEIYFGDYNHRYVGWHLLYNWLWEKWGAKRCGEILSDAMLNINRDKYDCLQMWLDDYLKDELAEPFVQAIYQYGISTEAHDVKVELRVQAMREAENERLMLRGLSLDELSKVKFELTESQLAREEETSQGDFKVARTGQSLKMISMYMNNCVFSYIQSMLRKECTIYYLKKDNKYLACIEVKKGAVIQASGPHNRKLEGEVLEAVLSWCTKHDLIYRARL